MHQLIKTTIGPLAGVEVFNDSAVVDLTDFNGKQIAFTTDSYVVSPIFFPGGDIGSLAVNGTVNDLSMVGAKPLYLSLGLIIEEGFPMELLTRVLDSVKEASARAGVRVVTGDTKVVNKGSGDGIFINTAGIGVVDKNLNLSPMNVMPGDVIIVSGDIGNHGVAVMAERNGLSFEPPVMSDTRPLNGLVEIMLEHTRAIHVMRDPTRGGLATTLKEIALESGVCIEIEEEKLPISEQVKGACELLGLDPLYVANEGILVAFVQKDMSKSLLEVMRSHDAGRNANIIGDVKASPSGKVLLKTKLGGTRLVEMLPGEQLPRIC